MKEIEEECLSNRMGKKMGKQVRIIPQLSFFLDTSLDDAERIEKELKGRDNPVL